MKGWTVGTGSFLQPPKSVPRADTAGISVWIPPAFTIINWCNVFVPLLLDLWALSGNFEFSSTKKEGSEDNGSEAEESAGICACVRRSRQSLLNCSLAYVKNKEKAHFSSRVPLLRLTLSSEMVIPGFSLPCPCSPSSSCPSFSQCHVLLKTVFCL